jgi:hypothetical protein
MPPAVPRAQWQAARPAIPHFVAPAASTIGVGSPRTRCANGGAERASRCSPIWRDRSRRRVRTAECDRGWQRRSSLSSARVTATRLVNDYTRGYLMMSLSQLIDGHRENAQSVCGRVPFIFSGGVEGVLSPHYAVFTVSPYEGDPTKARLSRKSPTPARRAPDWRYAEESGRSGGRRHRREALSPPA